MGMGDAVAQWDKIQEEFASNTLDMSKWGEIFYGGQPSREKFAKLICNINSKTFAKYAHNNKASRTLVGSKRGRPTREAAASKQAAKDRARMIRWQKKQAEELKQQQLLNNLVNTPGARTGFLQFMSADQSIYLPGILLSPSVWQRGNALGKGCKAPHDA